MRTRTRLVGKNTLTPPCARCGGNEVRRSGPRARNIDQARESGVSRHAQRVGHHRPLPVSAPRAANRPVFEHGLLNFRGGGEGGQGVRRASPGYLNFKFTNVYFYPGSRGRSAFVFFVQPICSPLFPSVIGRLSPDALNFKFRATTVSAVAATTDFRVFPPAYALSFVSVVHPLPLLRHRYTQQTPRDIYSAVSLVTSALLFMAPPGMYQN